MVVAILLADTLEVEIVDARNGLLMRCLLVVRLVTTTVVAVLLTDTSEAGIVDAVQGFLTESLLIIEFATTPVIAALFAHRLERVEAIKVGRGLQAERFPTLGVVITPVGVASLFDTPIQQLVSMPPALDEETSVGASLTEMLLLLLSASSPLVPVVSNFALLCLPDSFMVASDVSDSIIDSQSSPRISRKSPLDSN